MVNSLHSVQVAFLHNIVRVDSTSQTGVHSETHHPDETLTVLREKLRDGVVAVGNPVEGDLLPVPALAVARPFVPDFPHHHRTRDHRRELLAPGIGVVRGDVLRRRHDKGWWRSGYCHSHRDSARVRFGRRVQDLTIDEKVTRKKQLNAVPSGPLP